MAKDNDQLVQELFKLTHDIMTSPTSTESVREEIVNILNNLVNALEEDSVKNLGTNPDDQ